MTTGQCSVRERKRKMKRWGEAGEGGGGHERVSLSERSLSISQQAY